MQPLGTKVYLLKRYSPSDSFVPFFLIVYCLLTIISLSYVLMYYDITPIIIHLFFFLVQIQSCQTCTHLSIKVPKSSLMVFWMFSVHSQLHWSFISKHKIFRAISARAVSASSQTSKFGSVKVGLDFRLYQINVLISHKIIKATTRSQSALIHQLYTAISCLIGCTAFLTVIF